MDTVFYERRQENFFAGEICDHPYPSHVHDVTEIVCLTKGSVEMTVSGKPFLLIPGDIIVVFPSLPHGYTYVSEDAEGLMLIFQPDAITDFHHTFRTMQPVHPLLPAADKAPELDPIIQGFLKLTAQNGSLSLKLGYLHLFLSYLFSCLPMHPLRKSSQHLVAYQALQYVSEHFTEPLSLESVAHALGVSRIHLSHVFSQQLHLNFRQYLNSLRIEHARTLLQNPAYSISQVAYLCGYGNPRTFHRAFLLHHGTAPSQFRTQLTTREIT